MPDDRNAIRNAYDRITDTSLAERSRAGDDTTLLAEFCDHLSDDARVLDAGFEIRRKRLVNDSLGDKTGFLLARKPPRER